MAESEAQGAAGDCWGEVARTEQMGGARGTNGGEDKYTQE